METLDSEAMYFRKSAQLVRNGEFGVPKLKVAPLRCKITLLVFFFLISVLLRRGDEI